MQIKKPNQQEYKSAITMLNGVFGKNFPKLLPKLYAKDKNFGENHFVVIENNKVIGAIASIPLVYHIGDETMQVRGIGMVGTKKSARGRGVMSAMLDNIYKEAVESGAVAMCLGGNLERYNRHGFFPSGKEYNFVVRKKREYIDRCDEWSFCKLKENDESIKILQQMHDSQISWWERDDFFKTLQNWKDIPLLIKHNGQVVGYLIKQRFLPNIMEIVIDSDNLMPCLTAWVKRSKLDRLSVCINPYRYDLVSQMLQNSEIYSATNDESWSILDWKKAIKIMLTHKAKSLGLVDGEIVIEIGGQVLDIKVKNNEVSVSDSQDIANVQLSKDDATRMFFGVDGFYKTNTVLDEWLPVPIYMPSSDKV